MTHRCPVCKRVISRRPLRNTELPKFFPFCSERCKLIDLGSWLEGEYRIITSDKEDKLNGGDGDFPVTPSSNERG